ncbi:hypothetical protein ABH926_005061 [Catenulispora sp. GP43]|uniref:hypothetical protein n=1 Tax=Catenulispora sp. GP43 TaxID=3156263 RepID=UPI003518DFAD
MNITTTLTHWMAANPWVIVGAATACLLALLVLAVLIIRRARKAGRERGITTLINLAALLATSVQASGMWKFFGATMGLPVGFRVVLFGFMEIALLACGLRARANVEAGADAGVDGVLVWVLALASGVMSSTDASTAREALMRLLVAVVVALLWTRDLMAAKKAARAAGNTKKRSGPVRWRITPERVAVWLRLADAIDTDVTTVDSARRVAKFLRVTDRERDGWRFPYTAKARAYRGRMKLIGDALRHGDPTEVHAKLSRAAFADALTRLGIDDDSAPSESPAPVQGESEAPMVSHKVSQPVSLITPEHPAFAKAIASLPPAVNGTPKPRRAAAAASAPARRQAAVTARVGIDADSAAQLYRDSLGEGTPLSSRDLADAAGVSQSTASRIITKVRKEVA